MMRRSLLRALAGMVYGGLPPQRRDQVTPSSAAGVAPGSATGVFRGRTVIVSGTGAGVGFFEYSGAPAPGNPPVAYAVPPGVTADLFGNALPATGGGFVAVGSLGNIVQMINGSVNFISSVTTTPGSIGIATGDTRVVLASGQSTAKPAPSFFTLDGGTGSAGVALLDVVSFCISSTLAAAVTAALVEIQGSLGLTGIAAPGAPPAGNALLFSDTSGFLESRAGFAGDTNKYGVGEVNVILALTYTTTGVAATTIMSAPVGAGEYTVDVWMVSSNTVAADVGSFAFSGPAVVGGSPQLVDFKATTTGSGATTGYAASSTYTAAFTNENAAGNQETSLRLTVVFSAAGTLAITGAETVAGNTITVFAGARLRLRRPVN